MGEIFLQFEIKNDKPVDLNVLANSLNALSSQYDIFLKKSKGVCKKHERKLSIKNVRSGSIIIDLFGYATPLFDEMNTICEFGSYLKCTFDYFLGKDAKPTHDYTKKDCQDVRDIVDITARDGNNAVINLNVCGDNNTTILHVGSLSHTDANALQTTTKRYEEESLTLEEQTVFQRELMYWSDASFNSKYDKKAGKVIIQKIDSKPKKVIFLNPQEESIAKAGHSSHPKTEWQDLLRRVDIEVVKIQDRIIEYRILKLYDDVCTFED